MMLMDVHESKRMEINVCLFVCLFGAENETAILCTAHNKAKWVGRQASSQ